MKPRIQLAFALLFALAIAAPALADDPKAQAAADPAPAAENARTFEGKILCAKCGLAEEGRKQCQNVLVVEHDGKTEQYYLTKNAVYEKFGEVCHGTPAVRVTGEIKEADGKTWLTASEIVNLSDKG